MKSDLKFRVLGLDVSTKMTGYAVASVNGMAHNVHEQGVIRLRGAIPGRRRDGKRGKNSQAVYWEHIHPVKRIMEMRRRVEEIVVQHQPGLVVIEGYSYASPKRTHLPFLAECTGLIKVMLIEHGVPYILVTPSQLKKFATGKGLCKKDFVIDFANLLTDGDIIDDNEADAVILAAFAVCLAGSNWIGKKGKPKPWTSYNQDTVDRFRFDNSGGTAASIEEVFAHVASRTD